MNEDTIFIYENAIGLIRFAIDSVFWITEIDGASSVTVDISESRSNRQVGSSVSGQSIQSKIVSVDGTIKDPVVANRARLIDIFAPLVPATITAIEGAESWYLDVIPQKTPDISPGNGVQNFQMELFAAYPCWRTTASYSTQLAGLTSMFKFPFFTGGRWWISKYTDDYFSTVVNKGNIPIGFTVVIAARGKLLNPEIQHPQSQKKIVIQKPMIAGEKISISTIYGERGVSAINTNGTVTNGFKYLPYDSDLDMELLPGENIFRIDAAQNRENMSVRIESPEGVKSGV